MTSAETCNACEAVITVESPAGLCQSCLVQLALDEGQYSQCEDTVLQGQELGLQSEFTILDTIGRGGMGVVLKAQQVSLSRLVAIKILPEELASKNGFIMRFHREATVMAQMNHPNIVSIYDYGQAEGKRPYLVMEYIEGTDLYNLWREKKLSEDQTIKFCVQACEALKYGHDLGVIHRDIKPSNILVTKDGVVKVGDFGLAKLRSDSDATTDLTSPGEQMGTPRYMSPEQLEAADKVDHRTDIYSLGITLQQLLQRESGPDTLPSSEKRNLDARLQEIIARATQSSVEKRYQSAGDLARDLKSALEQRNPINQTANLVRHFVLIPVLLATVVILVARLKWADSGSRDFELPTTISSSVAGIELLKISGGTFLMGSASTEEFRNHDEDQIEITFKNNFFIGKTEVTQQQYSAVMGENPSHFKGVMTSNVPVESVSWNDANTFCKLLTTIDTEAGILPRGWSYRLPTEAEWEYACRAGATEALSGNALDNIAWWQENTEQPQPVGMKDPNAFGLLDMLGNVWEWCYVTRGVEGDGSGSVESSERLIRGGSWFRQARNCRFACRGSSRPKGAFDIGFRIVASEQAGGSSTTGLNEIGGLDLGKELSITEVRELLAFGDYRNAENHLSNATKEERTEDMEAPSPSPTESLLHAIPMLERRWPTGVPTAFSGTIVMFEGKLYARSPIDLTWLQAKKYAEAVGGHLATINSRREHLFLCNALCTNMDEVWIGGSDEVIEGHWRWLTNEPFIYSAWGLNSRGELEPNNVQDKQHHLTLAPRIRVNNQYGFNDTDGNRSRELIVEWEPDEAQGRNQSVNNDGSTSPITRRALVSSPAPLPDVDSWSIETKRNRSSLTGSALFSKDDQWIVGSWDGSLRFYSADSWAFEKAIIATDSSHLQFRYMGGSKPSLAAYGMFQEALLWDLDSLKKRPIPFAPHTAKYDRATESMAWFFNGRIEIRDSSTGRLEALFPRKGELDCSIFAFLPQKGQIATLTEDRKRIVIFNRDDESVTASHFINIDASHSSLPILSSCPNERYLVLNGWNWPVFVLDLETGSFGELLGSDGKSLRGSHHSYIFLGENKILFNPHDESAAVWSLEDRKMLDTRSEVESDSMAVSDLGQGIASVDDRVNLCLSHDGRTETVMAGLVNDSTSHLFSPETKSLVIGSSNGLVSIYSLTTREEPVFFQLPTSTKVVDIESSSSPRKFFVSCLDGWLGELVFGKGAVICNEIGTGITAPVQLEYSAKGNLLAIRSETGMIEVIDLAGGKIERLAHFKEVSCIDLGAGGAIVAVGSESGKSLIWNRASEKTVGEWQPGDAKVCAISISPDERFVGTMNELGLVSVYDIEYDCLTAEYRHPKVDIDHWNDDRWRLSMQWSADSETLVSVRQTSAMHFFLKDRSLVGPIQGGTLAVDYNPIKPSISPNGRLAVESSASFTRVWDALSGDIMLTIVNHDRNNWLIVDPEGHYRASPLLKDEVVYVTECDGVQSTWSQKEFADRFGWENDYPLIRSNENHIPEKAGLAFKNAHQVPYPSKVISADTVELGDAEGRLAGWTCDFGLPSFADQNGTYRIRFTTTGMVPRSRTFSSSGKRRYVSSLALNGHIVGFLNDYLDNTDQDDVERSIEIPFDGALLNSGKNTLLIRSSGTEDNLDDFEILRVEIDFSDKAKHGTELKLFNAAVDVPGSSRLRSSQELIRKGVLSGVCRYYPNRLALDSDKSLLYVSGHRSKPIAVNLLNGAHLAMAERFAGISHIALSSDKRFAVVARGPEQCQLIDLNGGTTYSPVRLVGKNPLNDYGFNRDGSRYYLHRKHEFMMCFETSTGRISCVGPKSRRAVMFPVKQLAALSAVYDTGDLAIWDMVDNRLLDKLTVTKDFVSALDVSSCERFVAIGTGKPYDWNNNHYSDPGIRGADCSVMVYDVVNKKILWRSDIQSAIVENIALSPNCKYVASVSRDGTVGIWETESGELIGHTMAHEGLLGAVQVMFLPDSEAVITGGNDRAVRIWRFSESGISNEHKL